MPAGVPVPLIDIVTMRGEMPRVAPQLLPDEVAVVARDCQFDAGVVAPLLGDVAAGTLPLAATSLFRYHDDIWFAWDRPVEAIFSPVAQDPYGRVYYTDGLYPKVTKADIAATGSNKPSAWYRLGVEAPEMKINIGAITPPAGSTDDELTDDVTRYYVETYVTGSGEEGPPGPASNVVKIGIPGSTVALSLNPPGSSDRNITHRRIYRSVSGSGTADFLLLVELPIAVGSYLDAKEDESLGPVLETYDYLPPPDAMRGLCLMANGIAAGFAGNELLFSAAYLPYAWPPGNRLTTEHDIVAIAAIGTALVVGTKGHPYICSGVSPSSITAQKVDVQQACVSARSMVALEGMVLYASPDGLVGIGSDGGTVVTEQIITRAQWQQMSPQTLRGWYHEGKYIGQSDSHGFIFDPKSGDLRTLTNRWDAAYHDMLRDELYLVKGTALSRWSRDEAAPLDCYWQSKPYELAPGTQLNCAMVVADEIAKVALMVWADGVLVLSLAKGSVPAVGFRLPAVRATRWQVAVQSQTPVHRIRLASSMMELQQ